MHNLLTTSVHNLMTLTVHEVLTLYTNSPESPYQLTASDTSSAFGSMRVKESTLHLDAHDATTIRTLLLGINDY